MRLLNGFANLIMNVITEFIAFQCLVQKLDDELETLNRVHFIHDSLAFRWREIENAGDSICEMPRFFLLFNGAFDFIRA